MLNFSQGPTDGAKLIVNYTTAFLPHTKNLFEMKTMLFIAILAWSTFTSCKKETEVIDENVAGKGIAAVKAKLTAGGWQMTTTILKYDNGTIDDGPLDACKTDDTYRYEAGGDATFNEGSQFCGIATPNGKYANWELLDDGARLKETYTRDFMHETAGTVVVYKVEFLSDDKMVVSRVLTEAGKTYTEVTTYKRG
jgi:hypothetical protein